MPAYRQSVHPDYFRLADKPDRIFTPNDLATILFTIDYQMSHDFPAGVQLTA
jgi:hypothetical protein